MSVHVCSLISTVPQEIPSGGYHVLRFPFAGESSDAWTMHELAKSGYQITNWRTDDRSGLIWPSRYGWASLTAVIQWEYGDYDELRDQFVRDPLRFTSDPENTTATEHRPPSPGMQCFAKHHEIFANPDTPLAVRVSHNASSSRAVVLAQFKVAIHDVAAPG